MITPTDLTTAYAPNPGSIDTQEPRFGWLLQSDRRSQSQSAYQILVASSAEDLQSGRADKWDSGKVISDRSVNVPYAGATLSSDETCYWQLRVWDQDDRAGAYTEPAAFTMGLLNESDWTGHWIGAPADVASPLLRKEFDLASPVSRARLHISGLGWYELYLNGRRVGDHRPRPRHQRLHPAHPLRHLRRHRTVADRRQRRRRHARQRLVLRTRLGAPLR